MRPTRGVAICVVLLLAGTAAAIAGIVRFGETEDRIADYPLVAAASSAPLELEEGELVGWYESSCFGCQGRESVSVAPSLRIDGPQPVDVEPYGDAREPRYDPGGILDYSIGRREGGPAYELDVPAAGRYDVRVGPSSEPDAGVRIGPSVEGRQIGAIAIAAAGFVIGGGALLVLLAWGLALLLRDATRDG